MTIFPDVGPTARALLALNLLQNRPGISAQELADRLGVTERSARRTITTMREVGVPVESIRGPHGGFRLGRGLRLPHLVFSASEATGLVMAVPNGSHAAADPDDPVGAALGKLIAALPRTVAEQASLVREHARAVPSQWPERPSPATLAVVIEAVASQNRLEITYATETRSWDELVDPWGVVVRGGRWYLLCHIASTTCAPTGSTESSRHEPRTRPSSHPPTSTPWPFSRSTWPRDGSTRCGSPSMLPSARSSRGSAHPWVVSSPPPQTPTDAY